MRDDLKAAWRSLASSWTFTAVALIVLILGIGAGTAIFSVVDAVVLRGLPFDEQDRLVAVGERRTPGPNPDANLDPLGLGSIAPPNYLDWAAQQQVFESMAAIGGAAFTLREAGAEPEDRFAELVIKTSGDPYVILPTVKSAVLAVMPDVPLRNVRTMEEVISQRVAQRRLNMLLLGLFGVLGLVISAVGIYGVMAYSVSQRTREIGVRMALGASRSTVVRMVMIRATILVAVGLVVGTAAAWALSGTASRFLFRLEHHDVRAFAAALATLAVAALIASAIPACRAASVDPMIALRAE